MRGGPLPRVDAVLLASFAGATGLDRAARAAVEVEAVRAGVRFTETPVLSFLWGGAPVYLTPTDAIALASGAILIIRFLAWVLGPVVRRIAGRD